RPLGTLELPARVRRPVHLPVVLTREEVQAVLAHLRGVDGTVVRLLYGSGLRLAEALRLRVKDLDFARGELTSRMALLRRPLAPRLRARGAHRAAGEGREGPGVGAARIAPGAAPRAGRTLPAAL